MKVKHNRCIPFLSPFFSVSPPLSSLPRPSFAPPLLSPTSPPLLSAFFPPLPVDSVPRSPSSASLQYHPSLEEAVQVLPPSSPSSSSSFCYSRLLRHPLLLHPRHPFHLPLPPVRLVQALRELLALERVCRYQHRYRLRSLSRSSSQQLSAFSFPAGCKHHARLSQIKP